MTIIYFVRHAEPDYSNHNDLERPLTPKGLKDRKLVTTYLYDKDIVIVLSSPFKRAIETVEDFSNTKKLSIEVIDDFRERKVGNDWIEDFYTFSKMQWEDFKYRLSNGECLMEVQERNINGLMGVLEEHKGKNIVIGSHGTALSTIINYFDPTYGFEDFMNMLDLMPWIVKFTFQDKECISIEKIDVFKL
jgi:2,3-bisphosphoglycerate-dependent phosphoglycerate mutase